MVFGRAESRNIVGSFENSSTIYYCISYDYDTYLNDSTLSPDSDTEYMTLLFDLELSILVDGIFSDDRKENVY